ncbi:hypothetical protein [Vibrio mediterranei]|uniref:hypothetical protein n=1 Tax=Vibrio mediterranei TaxID=689 RepID=UPI00148B7229|nr:hypothetical protein [Vibrio mediterranei]NOH31776.1 hypothetical protein [Vibrio mediterranei]
MRTITLSPNEQRRFGVGFFKFLLVREADEYINLLSDDGDTIRIDAGDKLDVSEFKELEIHNPHTTPIHVVYQLVKVDHTTDQSEFC